jgi:hypothetical protein
MKLPKIMGVLALAAGLAWPTEARAHSVDFPGLIALGVAGSVVGGSIAIGGIVTGIHNGVVGGSGVRPTNGWRYSGYTFNVLTATGGIAWLTAAVFIGSSDDDMLNLALGAGIPLTVIGGGGIALTAWSSQMPAAPAEEPRVTLVPSAVRDVSGRLAPGIGIVGVGF